MQTVTMDGVCLVGTRTRSYEGFVANDGRKVEAGRSCFIYVVDPAELGEPQAIKVPSDWFEKLRAAGLGTVMNVEARAFAKNNRIEWTAQQIAVADSGELLRAGR